MELYRKKEKKSPQLQKPVKLSKNGEYFDLYHVKHTAAF